MALRINSIVHEKNQGFSGHQLALPLRDVIAIVLPFNGACLLIVAMLGAIICGCGGRSGATPTETADITITGQPTNQSAPEGQTAVFGVTAQGGSALSYRWYKNGKAIIGASTSIYTTNPITSTDNGASFTVTITDNSGSAKSNEAVLSIGPRSPRMGDIRFKGVDFASSLPSLGGGNIVGLEASTIQNTYGSPLKVGSGICGSNTPLDCGWTVYLYQVSTSLGMSTTYASDLYTNLSNSISAASQPNAVISSLDEHPSNNVFALSYIQTAQTTGFDASWHTVSPENLQSSVVAEGLSGRVVTAISTNTSGQVDYLSYGWKQDSDEYDVLSVFATNSNVEDQASSMAAQGYIITAVGSSGTDNGFILVGTRIQGDSLPRPFALNQGFENGYAIVGSVFDFNGNTFLGEK